MNKYKRDNNKIFISKFLNELVVLTWMIIIIIMYKLGIHDIYNLSIICILNNITLLICMYFVFQGFLNIYSIFIILSLIFHFGQIWLYALSISLDNIKTWDIIALYPSNLVIESIVFCLMAINLMVFVGIIISPTKKKEYEIETIKDYKTEMYDSIKIATFGKVLFIIIIIPTLILDIQKLFAVAAGGYIAVFNVGSYILILLEKLFPLSIICIMYGNRYTLKKIKPLLIFVVIRMGILILLIGNRSTIMVQIVIYLYAYYSYKTNTKAGRIFRFIPVVVISLFIIMLMPYIAATRSRNVNINIFEFMATNNPFVLLVSELGASLITPVLAINYTKYLGFSYGKTFLSSLSILLPFSSKIFPKASSFISVSNTLNLYSPSKGALGGSFLAEMYFNFGWYSLILVLALAIGIKLISNYLLPSNQYKSAIFNCLLLYLVYGILIYVRGNFYDVVQHINLSIYAYIIYKLFELLPYKKSKMTFY